MLGHNQSNSDAGIAKLSIYRNSNLYEIAMPICQSWQLQFLQKGFSEKRAKLLLNKGTGFLASI